MEKLEILAKRLSREFTEWQRQYPEKKIETIVIAGSSNGHLRDYQELVNAMKRNLTKVDIYVEFKFKERDIQSLGGLRNYVIDLDYYLQEYFKQLEDRSVAD
ncbi:hypothetical protein DRN73_02395 [Candidatus Pacearchaeota archaeon]|nr:MAG: hypothetical protein DRN73_02395 [Candidatus Pacearchaeota archaeon]